LQIFNKNILHDSKISYLHVQFAESITTITSLMCAKLMLSRIGRRKGRAMGGTLWIAWVTILVVGVIVGACGFMDRL
jgi:hypothetical protein